MPRESPQSRSWFTLLLQERIEAEKQRLASFRVQPDTPVAQAAATVSGQPVTGVISLEDILRRPHVHYPCVSSSSGCYYFCPPDGPWISLHEILRRPHVHYSFESIVVASSFFPPLVFLDAHHAGGHPMPPARALPVRLFSFQMLSRQSFPKIVV